MSIVLPAATPSFNVIRRCAAGECEPDCNCDVCAVAVDVDELSDAELAHFAVHGTAAQRADIAAWLAEDDGGGSPGPVQAAPRPERRVPAHAA
jgi:hypothetical protein